MSGSGHDEIQPADAAARRRAIVAVAAIAVAGWVAFVVVQRWLAGLEGGDPAQTRETLGDALIWASWVAGLPVVVLAAWLWQFGGRTAHESRYPPPGARVIRDTPVLHGDAARVRGKLLQALAVVLAVFGASTILACYQLVERLGG